MDKSIDEHYVFRKLLSFFAANASLQSAVVSDLEEERFYDLSEGEIATKYPLQMLTMQLMAYTTRFWVEAGSSGFEYVDENLCIEIRELADAIICLYENNLNASEAGNWSVSTLHTKKIWNAMRRPCGIFLGQLPGESIFTLSDKEFLEGFMV